MSQKILSLIVAHAAVVLPFALGCSGEPTARYNGPPGRQVTVGTGGLASGGTGAGGSGMGGTGSAGATSTLDKAAGGSAVIGMGGVVASSGDAGVHDAAGGLGSGGGTGTAGSTGRTPSGGTVGSGGTPSAGGTSGLAGRSGGSGGVVAGGAMGSGGATSAGGTAGSTDSSTVTFDWGTSSYSPSGGSGVTYQGHFTGQTCVAPACHKHNIKYGGTIYQSNGSSTAGNVQIGIRMGSTLTTTYSGSQGNFFGSISGTDWANATIAIRNSKSTSVMPANAKASGDCNSCHSSSNRIVAP